MYELQGMNIELKERFYFGLAVIHANGLSYQF